MNYQTCEPKLSHSELVKKSRINEKHIPTDTEIMDLDNTIYALNECCIPWTQGTNRKLYKNKQLYASLLFHSSNIALYGKKISERIYCLLNKIDCMCTLCNKPRKFVSFSVGYSGCNNIKCEMYIRGIESWKLKCSDEEYKEKVNRSYGSLGKIEWFKTKYPNSYVEKYEEYLSERRAAGLNNRINSNRKFSSKAANEFFEELIHRGYDGYCAINKKEVMFDVSGTDSINSMVVFVDFLYGNKIIEYDGEYWHNKETDDLRDEYFKSIGYSTLRIYHSECSTKIDRRKMIERAIEFLNE